MSASIHFQLAAGVSVFIPWAAFGYLALARWFGRSLSERSIAALTLGALAGAMLAGLSVAARFLLEGARVVLVDASDWFGFSGSALRLVFVWDGLSLPVSTFGVVLLVVVGAFSRGYLHREAGFLRFYLLLALLAAGFQWVVLGGSLEVMLVGWELVGLSSALLIAFFNHRAAPVRHGFRAFFNYRIGDAALIAAVVWLHHHGQTGFVASQGAWAAPLALGATGVGVLLVLSSMAKSAQLPFTGWLPRAMEGPTPSSAIFYGALSVHLGPYLLLRMFPLIEAAPLARGLLIAVGLATALHGTFVGRVQTDIKSTLAYASATQVGIILVEIAFGLTQLALFHLLGHAAIRTLQILRSPNLLHDYQHLEQAMARQLPRTGQHLERLVPRRWQPWLYRFALERGYVDALLRDHVAAPLVRALRSVDRFERQWAAWLGGESIALRQDDSKLTPRKEQSP